MHLCKSCDAPSTLRCSGCSKVYYCSKKCQKDAWAVHIFDCNPKKPINTAYYLARAARRDRFPEDPQTCKDYGFERAFTAQNRSKLLGLFQGLVKRRRPQNFEVVITRGSCKTSGCSITHSHNLAVIMTSFINRCFPAGDMPVVRHQLRRMK